MRRNHRQVGYVQSGLILHLDSILNMGAGNAHSNSTTTWYDLSTSGNNVTLVSPSWSDAYLTFTGSTRGQTGANLNLSGRNQCTIEILLRTTGSTPTIILEQTSNYNNNVGAFVVVNNDLSPDRVINVGIRKTNAGAYLNGGFNATISDDLLAIQYNDTTNISTTELEEYLNVVKKTLTFGNNAENTTDTNLISAILYIGARGGGVAPFIGSIRAIRIYNRKLTLEELYQNKLEDFRRYGIIK